MATTSRGTIESFLASSYVERVNSCANLVLTEGNSLLSDEETHELAVLQMNRDFMKFMCHTFNKLSIEKFKSLVQEKNEGDFNNIKENICNNATLTEEVNDEKNNEEEDEEEDNDDEE